MEPANEEIIRRFLLGEMDEEERFEFEERFVEDEELFEQINVVEGELIEKYVRGWMQPAERAVFEAQFLTTDRRRERVEFSRELINRIDSENKSAAIASNEANTSEDETFFESIRRWFLTPQFAAVGAMGILVALFGTWLLFQNFGSDNQEVVKQNNSNVLETPRTNITPEIIPTPLESPEQTALNNNSSPSIENSVDPLIEAPKPDEIIQKTPEPIQTPEIKRSPPNPVLALFAGTIRSNGKNNELNLPENSKGATFVLNLPSVDYNIYQAELVDADGNSISQIDDLKPSKKVVRLFVNANKLIKGDYLIQLNGKNAAGEYESVADFQFRVQ